MPLEFIVEKKVTAHSYVGNPLSEDEVMMLIRAADKNGDGWLDFDEFLKTMIGK